MALLGAGDERWIAMAAGTKSEDSVPAGIERGKTRVSEGDHYGLPGNANGGLLRQRVLDQLVEFGFEARYQVG